MSTRPVHVDLFVVFVVSCSDGDGNFWHVIDPPQVLRLQEASKETRSVVLIIILANDVY